MELAIVEDGFSVKLTGNQIRFIRTVLGESQRAFARRIAVSQPIIYRLEKHGAQECSGPEVMLIDAIAKHFKVHVPDVPFVKDMDATEVVGSEAPVSDTVESEVGTLEG